jgi:hypothetical protein
MPYHSGAFKSNAPLIHSADHCYPDLRKKMGPTAYFGSSGIVLSFYDKQTLLCCQKAQPLDGFLSSEHKAKTNPVDCRSRGNFNANAVKNIRTEPAGFPSGTDSRGAAGGTDPFLRPGQPNRQQIENYKKIFLHPATETPRPFGDFSADIFPAVGCCIVEGLRRQTNRKPRYPVFHC